LPGGGSLAIEPTRALTAIDVDLGERKGADAKRVTRQANLAALAESARLLRLKGLGGLVVLDSWAAGTTAMRCWPRTSRPSRRTIPAFPMAPSAFRDHGTLHSRAHAARSWISCAAPTARSATAPLAQRLIRRLEAEAVAQPGARLAAACAPAIAAAGRAAWQPAGRTHRARFTIDPDPARPRDRFDVGAARASRSAPSAASRSRPSTARSARAAAADVGPAGWLTGR
jgi:hypothetical protein